eukprot:4527781-Alexandrium_andersonii.AAC.1
MKGVPMAVEQSDPKQCGIAWGARSLNCTGPGTAQRSPRLPTGAFRAALRAGSKSANESGDRGGPKSRDRCGIAQWG